MLSQQVRLCIQALNISINEFFTFVASHGLDDDVFASATTEGSPRLRDTLVQLQRLCEIAEERMRPLRICESFLLNRWSVANVLHEMRSPMRTTGSCSIVMSHQPFALSQTTQEYSKPYQDFSFESHSVGLEHNKLLENPIIPGIIQDLPCIQVQAFPYPGDPGLPAIASIPPCGLSQATTPLVAPISYDLYAKPPISCLEPLDQFAHCKILLVEDNMINQRVMLKILGKLGLHHVTLAADGQMAVDIVQEYMDTFQPFDFIFMDESMPVLSGHNATRMIREMGFQGPICGMLVNIRLANKQKAFEAGVTTIIQKPFQSRAIREILELHLTPQQEESEDTMLPGLVDESPLPRQKPAIKSRL